MGTAPRRLQAAPSRGDRDAVWIRVGVPRRDPDDASGDLDESSEGHPDDPTEDASPVSVSEVESALDGLDVEVEALGAPDGDEDLLRVVDHYERLIAERDRAIRDRKATRRWRDPAHGRGLLAAVRARLGRLAARLRR